MRSLILLLIMFCGPCIKARQAWRAFTSKKKVVVYLENSSYSAKEECSSFRVKN